MAIIQTLLHYGSYLAAFYAVYLLAAAWRSGWCSGRKSTASHSASRCRCACVCIRSGWTDASAIRITAEA